MTNNFEDVYVSVLTMIEDKESGEVEVRLQFSDMDFDEGEAPESYNIMSTIAENYLQLSMDEGDEDVHTESVH